MTKLRIRTSALLVWLLLFFNIERFHAPINIASFVYVLAAIVSIAIVMLRRQNGIAFGTVVSTTLVAFLVSKWLLGYQILGTALPLTVTEACSLLTTASFARLIAQAMHDFESNAQQVLHMHFDSDTPELAASQTQLYKEVRRARRHNRPLSILALNASNATNPELLNRFIEEVQRRGIRKYIDARLAQVITSCISDCDILVYSDDCFFVMCPEIVGEEAEEVSSRLKEAVRQELGVTLNIGSASFPEQEVTLGGLLEKAIDALHGKETPTVATPQRVPSFNTAAAVEVNVIPSSS
ncbi:MAG: hypothetical protein H8E66_16320 [Planctomycetes bacterium]|nr:hypothetical protein [Planctomycetota bacterium]